MLVCTADRSLLVSVLSLVVIFFSLNSHTKEIKSSTGLELSRLQWRLALQQAQWINSSWPSAQTSARVNISTIFSIFDGASSIAGIWGPLRVLEPPKQEIYIRSLLTWWGKSQLMPNWGLHVCSLGSKFWPEHWVGAYLVHKVVKNPTQARSVIYYLQNAHHVPGLYYMSSLHGVQWEYLAPQIRSTGQYPTAIATQWCGDGILSKDPVSNVTIRLGGKMAFARECVHGIGHAVYYALAPPNEDPCVVLRPCGWTMDETAVQSAIAICGQAPSPYTRFWCCSGIIHSFRLYQEDRCPDHVLPLPRDLRSKCMPFWK